MKNDETIDFMQEIRTKNMWFGRKYFFFLFSAIHPAEKRLYANGDFEGVRRKEFFRIKISCMILFRHHFMFPDV